MVETEQLEAPLDAASCVIAGRDTGLVVAPHLGGQHEAVRQSATLTQYHAKTPLALAIACGSIDKMDRPVKDGPSRGKGSLLSHRIGKVAHQLAQFCPANAQRMDQDARG